MICKYLDGDSCTYRECKHIEETEACCIVCSKCAGGCANICSGVDKYLMDKE